jgi:DNA-binding transcriptional LysR family regulator
MTENLTDLNDLQLFAQVAAHRGFNATAQALGIPKSRVSRHVARLEATLGVRLVQRTPRQWSLTDAGHVLLQHCQAMLDSARAGEEAVRSLRAEPSGLLRLSVPAELSDSLLSGLLPRFMQQHPLVHLDVEVTNRIVNLVEEGVDLAIRGTTEVPADSSNVLFPLGQVNWLLVASPDCLAQAGAPASPEALQTSQFLAYGCSRRLQRSLQLYPVHGGAQRSVLVQARMQSDNLKVLQQAALAGLGVCGLPLYCCGQWLEQGDLVQVLPGWRPRAGRLVAMVPSRQGMSPAARALLGFLKSELAPLLDLAVV